MDAFIIEQLYGGIITEVTCEGAFADKLIIDHVL